MKAPERRAPSDIPTSDLRPPSSVLCVIVVNFNSSAHARRCIESVLTEIVRAKAEATESGIEVVVIDNASSDNPAALLKHLPHTTLVINERNVGFGVAVNQAARMTDAPLLWLLNPDCEVVPGAFTALQETLSRHPECAIAAPQLLNADGSTQASARGAPDAWTGLFGRHSLLSHFFPSSRLARLNLPADDLVASGVESAVVDWVMGAAMLIRREPFDRVNGFDERYFLYWEDADLCRRLRIAGFTTRYVPRALVWHPGAVSAGTDSVAASRAFHRSAYLYYATHVAPQWWHPARWLARVALPLRAWWRTRG